MNAKKKALGRGLSALLSSPETDITSFDSSGRFILGAIANITLSKIESNPFQPRADFEKEALNNLANSIKEQGIIQPITVRKLGYDKYQLICGERRLKAAYIAKLKEIPAFIRLADDQQMLEMALVENIQREDLNALDIAISYNRLIEECNLTQEKLSERVGKNRTTITNYIRLLKLPAEIQIALRDNKISMGHARPLINLKDTETQINILNQIINNGLSVREVENIVKNLSNLKTGKSKQSQRNQLAPKFVKIQKNLASKFPSGIELKRNNKGKGSIVIPFKSDEDLERIVSIIENHD